MLFAGGIFRQKLYSLRSLLKLDINPKTKLECRNNGPKGLQLEVGVQRGPWDFQCINIFLCCPYISFLKTLITLKVKRWFGIYTGIARRFQLTLWQSENGSEGWDWENSHNFDPCRYIANSIEIQYKEWYKYISNTNM